MAGVGPTEGIFLKGFCCRWLGCGVGKKFLGVKLLSRSSMNFLADGPASCSVTRSYHVHRGSPALAPALVAKIDAVCGR